MNEDARENHTLRDALLIATVGTAAIGGAMIGGAKLIEKDLGVAKKYTKRATDKIIETEQNAKKTTDKILTIENGVKATGGGTTESITRDPPKINSNNSTDKMKTTAEKIKEQQEFASVLMERFEAEENPALKAKLKEQIEAIKENIASYQLGNKK